jgi:hypothetical protein
VLHGRLHREGDPGFVARRIEGGKVVAGEAELDAAGRVAVGLGCRASLVSPVANSVQKGDWKARVRPSLSRWKAIAWSMSVTYLIA